MLFELDQEFQQDLARQPLQTLKYVPRPYFFTRLFPESPICVCRPLFAPFDHFAITHYGEVFCRKPLITMQLGTIRIIDPSMVLIPKMTKDDRSVVSLQNNVLGIKKSFLIDRLMLNLFYGVGLYDRLAYVEHMDGDNGNNHINNLVAHYVDLSSLEFDPIE